MRILAWLLIIIAFAHAPASSRPADAGRPAVSQALPSNPSAYWSAPAPVGKSWWDLSGQKDALSATQSLVTIIAIILGAVWGYFKVIAGRIYTSRLETSISGDLRASGPCPHLAFRVSVKNVGLTRVYLNNDLSNVLVSAFTEQDYYPRFHKPDLTQLGTVQALIGHEWIEPGECVTEDRLLALPAEPIMSVDLRFRLFERPRRFKKGNAIQWTAVAVVMPTVVNDDADKAANVPGVDDGPARATAATAAATTRAETAGAAATRQ